jgi:hypothetical protein
MLRTTTLGLLLFTLLFFACGNDAPNSTRQEEQLDPKAAEQAAWDEMMEIHDAVMPKMADLNRVSRELKTFAMETVNKKETEEINDMVEEIEEASEGMMSWMGELQQLSQLRVEKSHEEIMDYLNEETAEIAEVREEMNESLKEGQEMLRRLKPETN